MHMCKCMSSTMFYEGQCKRRGRGREGCILVIREDLSVESVAKILKELGIEREKMGTAPSDRSQSLSGGLKGHQDGGT